ncbi:MAG: aromatic ring-hydroxylating dioxygenase subunit alpha [Flavobacteriaceae bacterium]|nr:aromatic ring-hydroxylating dioxygenase subunit alpha [Bacteroidia bacterium]MBT8286406.1 aromatic ring-hydroxylating dioxygenase subunit alpha [Bacteroidia bacterium]NNF74997.1 aromatic ring-hydroxylating dioxygenase subunit alpha [Flavobacteriaceae bacterium]NNK73199.1 aromatic ring-hydroxylating dioxygenase subunit alpha [Flavobacteriaceae bacterium]
MSKVFNISSDIKNAETLPAEFYRSQDVFEAIKEKVFLRTWQYVGDENLVQLTESVHPFILLNNYLTEPLVLTRDKEDNIRCFSNVCTHRGNIVVNNPGKARQLVCMYHGRRFGLNGAFKSMPEFEKAENFPRPCDDLHEFVLRALGPFLFTGLNPAFDFDEVLSIMTERIGFLPLHEFKFEPTTSRDYLVNCHWALYCDNYLEGFHIPFVHQDLNEVLDYGSYTTEIYEHANLQIGYANDGTEIFDLPEYHKDYGKSVGAYYYWVFPNMMFNFYPWGLSINVVKPISLNKTRVSFITYVYDENKFADGAAAMIDKVEREDEFVVEGVHKGVQSRFYNTGRFSPTREKGVHHFHGLLAKYLSKS